MATLESRIDRLAPVPASAMQNAFWSDYQIGDMGPTHHTFINLRFQGKLDVDAMLAAYQTMIVRHPVLTVRFTVMDGKLFQVPMPEASSPLPIRAAKAGPGGPSDMPEVRDLIGAPFDLESDSPCRSCLFSLGAEDWLLVIVIHHIAMDRASAHVMCTDLATAYNRAVNAVQDASPAELEAETGFFEYAERETESPDDVAYWHSVFATGLETMQLPASLRPAPSAGNDGPSWEMGTTTDVVVPALRRRLSALARTRRTTVFSLITTALRVLLYRYGNDGRIAIVTSANTRPAGSEAVGPFVAIVPVVAEINRDWDIATAVAEVTAAARGAFLRGSRRCSATTHSGKFQ
jgi:hypothetical protein